MSGNTARIFLSVLLLLTTYMRKPRDDVDEFVVGSHVQPMGGDHHILGTVQVHAHLDDDDACPIAELFQLPAGDDLVRCHVRVQLDFHIDLDLRILQVALQRMQRQPFKVHTGLDKADLFIRNWELNGEELGASPMICRSEAVRPVFLPIPSHHHQSIPVSIRTIG